MREGCEVLEGVRFAPGGHVGPGLDPLGQQTCSLVQKATEDLVMSEDGDCHLRTSLDQRIL